MNFIERMVTQTMTREQCQNLKPTMQLQYEDPSTGFRYKFSGPFVLYQYNGVDCLRGLGVGTGLVVGGSLACVSAKVD